MRWVHLLFEYPKILLKTATTTFMGVTGSFQTMTFHGRSVTTATSLSTRCSRSFSAVALRRVLGVAIYPVSQVNGLIELALLARWRELGAQLEARAHLDADDVTAAVADQVVAGAMIAHDDEFVLLAEAMPRDRLNALLTGADSPLHRINMRVYGPLFARAIGAGLLRTDVSVDAMVTWLQGVMTMLAGRSDLDEGSMHDVVDTFVVPSLFS